MDLFLYNQPFRAEYLSVLNRAVSLGYTLPSRTCQYYQNIFISELVECGAFQAMDLIYLLSNESAGLNFARINLKNPSQYPLVDEGAASILYLDNYGPYADTSSSSWGALNTQWAPSNGVNFTQNSNTVIHGRLSGFGGSGYGYRADEGSTIALLNLVIDGSMINFNNSGALGIIPKAADVQGVWMTRRTSSTASVEQHFDYFSQAMVTDSSVSATTAGLSTEQLRLLAAYTSVSPGYNQSSMSSGVPIDVFMIGGSLTDAQCVRVGNAIINYVNSLRYSGQIADGNTSTYTVPAGITSLLVECWGGGGAGRGFPNSTQTVTGAGGGGGAYAAKVCTVTPGASIPYTCGSAGVGNTGAGTSGGDTSWNSGEVLAKAGLATSSNTVAGAGGLASASTGTTKYNGGSGGSGGASLSYSTGSGGAAAGSGGNGMNGVDAVLSGVLYRPNYNVLGGGTPGYSQPASGNSGGILGSYGAGGSGARRGSSGAQPGGNGGVGVIRLSVARDLIVY